MNSLKILTQLNVNDNSFISNHYVHIITGNLDINNNNRFCNSYPKAESIKNQNKFVLRKLMKKYKLVLIFIERISNDKVNP